MILVSGGNANYAEQGGALIRRETPAAPSQNQAIFDSNADLAAGSRSLGLNFSVTVNRAGLCVASFAPAPAATGNFLPFM